MSDGTVRVPKELKEKLEKAAIDVTIHKKERVTMSDVLRRLMRDHLNTTVATMKKEQ